VAEDDETPTPFSWVNGRVAALLAVLIGAVSLVNLADRDWLPAAGFGLFAVVMVIQALDDLRWHGRHEPLTGTVRKWISASIILIAVLLLGELLFAK
jgi:hypothetical protein